MSHIQFPSTLECIMCRRKYDRAESRMLCECGGLLQVTHNFTAVSAGLGPLLKATWALRQGSRKREDQSGVWRFREAILSTFDASAAVTRREGNAPLFSAAEFPKTSAWLGMDGAHFSHQGFNPTGSFKDCGMTVAVSVAKSAGAKAFVCASTGNTSASVASYASLAGIPAVVLISERETALGKVAQSLSYGAKTLKIRGDFDAAMGLVMAHARELGLTVLNSVNPFRLEGQKAMMLAALEALDWKAPDWIVVPGGNLGNASAFGKALREAEQLGLISRLPRIAVVQAATSDPFYLSWITGKPHDATATTIATAIRIGKPVNMMKALVELIACDGTVTAVTDEQIMDAKAVIDSDGIGAEPASCAAVAGLKRLRDEGKIGAGDSAVVILTGHALKDPDATVAYHSRTLTGYRPAHPADRVPLECARANAPVIIDPTLDALRSAIGVN